MNCPARACGALAAASASRMELRDPRGALRMPLSHFCGGLKSPTRQSRSGDGAPPLPCTGGFTLNRFTVNGFTPPVDARRHGRSRKPFGICSCKKCVRNSPGICSYKTKDLNFPGINSYKNTGWGGTPSCFLASVPFSHFQRRGSQCPGNSI